jgi:hypothetical protein
LSSLLLPSPLTVQVKYQTFSSIKLYSTFEKEAENVASTCYTNQQLLSYFLVFFIDQMHFGLHEANFSGKLYITGSKHVTETIHNQTVYKTLNQLCRSFTEDGLMKAEMRLVNEKPQKV